MEVKLVKLITGDEIIAELETSEDGTFYTLKNMVKLGMDHAGNVGFVHYPAVSEKEEYITVLTNNVIFTVPVNEECENAYKQTFGHIVGPTKSLIV